MTETRAVSPPGAALQALARQECLSYLRHPLFLVGALLTIVVCIPFSGDAGDGSTPGLVIGPALAIGVFGLLVMNGLTKRSDRLHAAAGTVVVPERTRTLALACATVVPFTAALGFFAFAVWGWHHWPPAANTLPPDAVSDGWAYVVLFALGVLPAVGGPVLGLAVARWVRFRGAAILVSVVLVLVTMVMQGLVESLRYGRVFWPWTYFGGPFGVDGDRDRWAVLTGSPQWYCLYLVALCVLGVLVALLHDHEQPRGRLARIAGATVVVALGLGVLAMTQGVQEPIVNPRPSPASGG